MKSLKVKHLLWDEQKSVNISKLKRCINIFDDNDNDDDDDDDDDDIAIAEQLTLSIFHSVETLRCFCWYHPLW